MILPVNMAMVIRFKFRTNIIDDHPLSVSGLGFFFSGRGSDNLQETGDPRMNESLAEHLGIFMFFFCEYCLQSSEKQCRWHRLSCWMTISHVRPGFSCWPKPDAAKLSAMEVSPTHIKCQEKRSSNTATVCANAYAVCIAAFVASTWSARGQGWDCGSPHWQAGWWFGCHFLHFPIYWV